MSDIVWILICLGISTVILAGFILFTLFTAGIVVLIVALIKTNSRKHKQKKDVIDVEAKVVDEKKE